MPLFPIFLFDSNLTVCINLRTNRSQTAYISAQLGGPKSSPVSTPENSEGLTTQQSSDLSSPDLRVNYPTIQGLVIIRLASSK